MGKKYSEYKELEHDELEIIKSENHDALIVIGIKENEERTKIVVHPINAANVASILEMAIPLAEEQEDINNKIEAGEITLEDIRDMLN